jgi:phosphate starvation-inducible PhoH-like protein
LKTKRRVLSFSGVDPLMLFGARDNHLAVVDREFPGAVVVRGDEIILNGTVEQLERLTEFFREIIDIAREGRALSEQDYRYILSRGNGGSAPAANGESVSSEFSGLDRDVVVSTRRGTSISPRTPGQKRYLDAIRTHDIVFGIGPAGTGKTYLAVASAVAALRIGAIERVFLVRPVVEAGESLGFLRQGARP